MLYLSISLSLSEGELYPGIERRETPTWRDCNWFLMWMNYLGNKRFMVLKIST